MHMITCPLTIMLLTFKYKLLEVLVTQKNDFVYAATLQIKTTQQ